MAIKLLAKFNQAAYEEKIGKYVLTRKYKIENCSPEECIGLKYGAAVNPDGEPATDTIPIRVDIEHMSTLCDAAGGTSDSETVRCYATNRTAENPPEMEGFYHTHMTVIYEGWVHQVLWWEERILTASEQILASIDATPMQIGAEAQGTSVFRPRIELNIYENVSSAKLMFGGYQNLIEELTGTVNEDDWNPAVTEVNLLYPEGTWLYMGAAITYHARFNFSIVHRFLQVPKYCNCGISWGGSGDIVHEYGSAGYPCALSEMQIYRYRDYRVDGSSHVIAGSSIQVERRTYGDEIGVKVYCIAGTDTVHDFADLGL